MEQVRINNLGIPPLAGICGYQDAYKTGYEVEYNVNLLKRYNYVKVQLNQIFAAHIARTPEWEVKCGISHHMWLEAEHSAALRKRVSEMREPPLHMDRVSDEHLKLVFEELIRSENTIELLIGIYRVVKPEMIHAMKHHLNETNPLTDYPTRRILKFMLLEEEEMAAWGQQAIAALTAEHADKHTAADWERHLSAFLAQAGGISGDAEIPELLSPLNPRYDGKAYVMDPAPRRDQRFQDHFNQSALIDQYYVDEKRPYDERVYALLYKRLREMDVPEWMGPIIYKTKGKPWDYYLDMSRQLWDECRHSMMGEVGLHREGVPFYRYPLDLKSSITLNLHYEPFDSHLILWGIEQSLMPKDTGKRLEWVIAKASDNPLAALFQDYDWADEVLHAQIGRKWLLPEFTNADAMQTAAKEKHDEWAKFKLNYSDPLSEHKEWWNDFLTEARYNRGAAAVG